MILNQVSRSNVKVIADIFVINNWTIISPPRPNLARTLSKDCLLLGFAMTFELNYLSNTKFISDVCETSLSGPHFECLFALSVLYYAPIECLLDTMHNGMELNFQIRG